jgi:hypothetical protein
MASTTLVPACCLSALTPTVLAFLEGNFFNLLASGAGTVGNGEVRTYFLHRIKTIDSLYSGGI